MLFTFLHRINNWCEVVCISIGLRCNYIRNKYQRISICSSFVVYKYIYMQIYAHIYISDICAYIFIYIYWQLCWYILDIYQHIYITYIYISHICEYIYIGNYVDIHWFIAHFTGCYEKISNRKSLQYLYTKYTLHQMYSPYIIIICTSI